jgi:hypothetical protein
VRNVAKRAAVASYLSADCALVKADSLSDQGQQKPNIEQLLYEISIFYAKMTVVHRKSPLLGRFGLLTLYYLQSAYDALSIIQLALHFKFEFRIFNRECGMKRRLFIIFFLLLVLLPAAAQKPRITVIPFSSIGLSKSDAESLTLLFEAALQNTGAFTLIEQVKVNDILRMQEYSLGDNIDEQYAVEIGRLLSADQIVLGTVGKTANLYYLAVKMIDVQTGQNLIAWKEQSQQLSALVERLDSITRLLAGREQEGPISQEIVRLDVPLGKYIGTVKGGKPHGQGALYYNSGARYEGEFRDGKWHGQGTLYLASGARYEGEFRDGTFNGQGTLYYASGNRYEGEFRDGKRHGQGTLYLASGERYEGRWMDDKLVGVRSDAPLGKNEGTAKGGLPGFLIRFTGWSILFAGVLTLLMIIFPL